MTQAALCPGTRTDRYPPIPAGQRCGASALKLPYELRTAAKRRLRDLVREPSKSIAYYGVSTQTQRREQVTPVLRAETALPPQGGCLGFLVPARGLAFLVLRPRFQGLDQEERHPAREVHC